MDKIVLTFESDADTTVPVYYTKEPFVNGTPDETISLKANERKITTINKPEIYRFGVSQYDPSTLKFKSANTAITFVGVKGTVLDGHRLFDRALGLKEMDVSEIDTSKMIDMDSMFSGYSKSMQIISLDISHFDTSNVTTMRCMFQHCSNLTSLDVSHFDTSKVTDMSFIFNSCSSLTFLDLSKFDTSKVTNMVSMFERCTSLKKLDISKFDTSNTIDINNMFFSCSSLVILDVINWNTSNTIDMHSVFPIAQI